jgi:hypothetical protein
LFENSNSGARRSDVSRSDCALAAPALAAPATPAERWFLGFLALVRKNAGVDFRSTAH